MAGYATINQNEPHSRLWACRSPSGFPLLANPFPQSFPWHFREFYSFFQLSQHLSSGFRVASTHMNWDVDLCCHCPHKIRSRNLENNMIENFEAWSSFFSQSFVPEFFQNINFSWLFPDEKSCQISRFFRPPLQTKLQQLPTCVMNKEEICAWNTYSCRDTSKPGSRRAGPPQAHYFWDDSSKRNWDTWDTQFEKTFKLEVTILLNRHGLRYWTAPFEGRGLRACRCPKPCFLLDFCVRKLNPLHTSLLRCISGDASPSHKSDMPHWLAIHSIGHSDRASCGTDFSKEYYTLPVSRQSQNGTYTFPHGTSYKLPGPFVKAKHNRNTAMQRSQLM